MKTQTKWHPIHACNDGVFNSASGIKVSILDPKPEMFTIHDIAGGLGKICRFGGQIDRFYSVAQHSVLVAKLAPDHLKKAAILHDASEAYLGDVIKPLKNILGTVYEEIEERFMLAICERFHVDPSQLKEIKQWDMEMLEREHEAFQKGCVNDWSDWMKRQFNYTYAIWNPNHATAMFFAEFFLINDKEVFI